MRWRCVMRWRCGVIKWRCASNELKLWISFIICTIICISTCRVVSMRKPFLLPDIPLASTN